MSKMNSFLKCQKEFPDFIAEVASLSTEELNSRLAQIAKDTEAVYQTRDEDEELVAARENAKLLAAPYRECLQAFRLKSAYMVALIKERGQV